MTANAITGLRIACGVALLFCPALSPAFYALYVIAGASDMVDGAVARRTNTVSEFGSRLDTAADIVLVAACLIKLPPALDIPAWAYLWTALIALIKIINIVSGYAAQGKLATVHSTANRVAGGMLFLLPLTLPWIDLRYGAALACAVATFAAVQEGHIIRTMNTTGHR